MQELTFKERLSERLAEFPLLRTILLNLWFATVLFLASMAGVAAMTCLPKFIVTSPPGFQPVVKVSVLDLLQAYALRRSANRLEARGDHQGAALAWQSAIANNLADPDLYRGALQQLAQAPELPMPVAVRTLGAAFWLLRLGGTNQADVGAMAAAFDKYGLADEVYTLLRPIADRLSPALEAAYLKSLFAVGRYDEFAARWEKTKELLPADPALSLCRAAWLAGWGPVASLSAARRQLQAAGDDVKLAPLACRLEMAVACKRLEVEDYRQALERLHESSLDRVQDHTVYWRLLASLGRKEEARQLAVAFSRPLSSPLEVLQIADAFSALDLDAQSLEFLSRHAAEFGGDNSTWSVAVWAAYADRLIAARDWEDLPNVATRMRAIPGAHEALDGFGYYLEGRAAYGRGAMAAAENAFTEAVKAGFPVGPVGLPAAEELLKMGYPKLALEALAPLESRFGNEVRYWRETFEAAYALRQDDTLLLKAATRAHQLDPASTEWKFNYTAALLISRRRPEEALRLTMELAARDPGSVGAALNHAIALGMNGRPDDAAKILEACTPALGNDPQRTAYHLGWLAVHRERAAWEQVRADLDNIDPQELFPSQKSWVEEIRRSLPQ